MICQVFGCINLKISDICLFSNGKGHEQVIDDNGKYIVVNSKFISTNTKIKKYSNKQLTPLFKNDITMVMSDLPNGKALAKCFLVDENNKYTLNQRICSLHTNNENLYYTKYLFYILSRNRQLLAYDNGVDQTNLRKDDILNIKIPILSLKRQQKIVEILDSFDEYINSMDAGLKGEIEKRHQQYEFYRDKLLSFKRLEE